MHTFDHYLVAFALAAGTTTASLTPLWSTGGHSEAIAAVAASPVNGAAASGSNDTSLQTWSLPSISPVKRFGIEGAPISSVDYSYDGSMIAAAAVTGQVRALRVSDGEVLYSPELGAECVRAIDMHPTQNLLCVAECRGQMSVHNVDTDTLLSSWAAPTGDLVDVQWSLDGAHVVAVSGTGSVFMWTTTGALVRTFSVGSPTARCVVMTNVPGTVLVGLADGSIKSWDTQSGVAGPTYAAHSASVNTLAVVPGGVKLVSGSSSGEVKRWTIGNTTSELTINALPRGVASLAVLPNGRRVLSGGPDRRLVLHNLDTGAVVSEPYVHSNAVSSLVLSSDGNSLLSASIDGSVCIEAAATGVVSARIVMPPMAALPPSLANAPFLSPVNPVTAARFHPQSGEIVTSTSDGKIRIWSSTGTLVRTLDAHSDVATDVVCGASGAYLATVSVDQTLKFWTYATGTLRRTVSLTGLNPMRLAEEVSGSAVYVVIDDAAVKRVRVADGVIEWSQGFSGALMTSISVDPSGAFILVGDTAGNVHRLSASSGSVEASFVCSKAPVNSIQVVQGTTVFCVATQDQRAALRSVSDGSLLYDDQGLVQTGVTALASQGGASRLYYGHKGGGVSGIALTLP